MRCLEVRKRFFHKWISRTLAVSSMAFFAFVLFVIPAVAATQSAVVTPKLNVAIPGINFSSGQTKEVNGILYESYLATYINGVYNYVLSIVVIAASIMLVYGGFKYVVSASLGDVQKGKDTIRDAIIGLILVFGSYTLLQVLNPAFGTLKPVEVSTVDLKYYSALATGDAPPSENARLKAEAVAGATAEGISVPVVSGSESSSIDSSKNMNQGCGPNGYKPVSALCTSLQSCFDMYCKSKSSKAPEGLIERSSTFVSFKGLPVDTQQSVARYGLQFMYGPDKTLIAPEAKESLLKAGKIALDKGYFLFIQDVARPFDEQVKQFCERVQRSMDSGGPLTSEGLALPGGSNHGLGIAVDVHLRKLVDGKAKELTPRGTVCNKNSNVNQVDAAVALGLENVSILQDIMMQAGWKRLCSELWHFDYKGVYEHDCFKCAFPPNPPRGDAALCKPIYRPPT